MNFQIIITPAGEELVVVPRGEFDALLARGGDEEAEDRMTVRIAQAVRARLAAGEERLVAAGSDVRPPKPNLGIGERIRAARKARRMSQVELAAAAGIGQGYLSEIERGEKTPSDEVLERLVAALGMTLTGR